MRTRGTNFTLVSYLKLLTLFDTFAANSINSAEFGSLKLSSYCWFKPILPSAFNAAMIKERHKTIIVHPRLMPPRTIFMEGCLNG